MRRYICVLSIGTSSYTSSCTILEIIMGSCIVESTTRCTLIFIGSKTCLAFHITTSAKVAWSTHNISIESLRADLITNVVSMLEISNPSQTVTTSAVTFWNITGLTSWETRETYKSWIFLIETIRTSCYTFIKSGVFVVRNIIWSISSSFCVYVTLSTFLCSSSIAQLATCWAYCTFIW